VLPTAVPVLSVHLEQPDVLARLADGRLIDLEFQMRGAPDLWRFLHDTYAAVAHHQAPLQTVVVSGPGIARAPDTLELGSLAFRVTNVLVGQREAEEMLAELGAKRARGEVLDAGDRTRLVLLPLMHHRQGLLADLRRAVALLEGVEAAELRRTVGAMAGMAYNYLDEAQAEALLEVLKMANALEDLVAQTLEQGRLEARRDDLAHLILRRFRLTALPSALAERLAQADEATLIAQRDRLLDVASVDEL
jgi:hypothetical protein